MSIMQVVNICLLIGACILTFFYIRAKRRAAKFKGDIRKHEVFTSPTAPSDQKEGK